MAARVGLECDLGLVVRCTCVEQFFSCPFKPITKDIAVKMAMRSNVLSMYRRMLRVASRLGDKDRTKAERKIRDGFRRWSGVREADT